MKVLMLTPYVTINSRPEFTKNKTGFGYMVYDIAHSIGEIEKVDVLCSDSRGEEFCTEGVCYLKRSIGLFLVHLFQCVRFTIFMKMLREYKITKGAAIRLFYYWMMSGYLVHLLKKGKYDIVHIHQNVFDTEIWIAACRKCNQKYLITLHGLNSFSDTVRLEPAGKQYERDMLKRVIGGEFPVTVISSGMKKLIEKTFGEDLHKCITVVCNAFSFSESIERIKVKELYHLPDDSSIIVCVGNICERKNQGQLIKSFSYLPASIADKTYVLFLGGNIDSGYTIENLTDNNPMKDHFVSCGVVAKELVPQYYEQCNAVALMSLSEGFGLSLIEGMHYGKPSMSFTDVDAFEDIYHPDAMVGVEEHSDQAVAKGMEELLTRKWDNATIIRHSKKFEASAMAGNYIKVYNIIIKS